LATYPHLTLFLLRFIFTMFKLLKNIENNYLYVGIIMGSILFVESFIIMYSNNLNTSAYGYLYVYDFVFITLILYIFVHWWLNVERSISSYLAFLGNVLILSLYILGFVNLIKGLPNPIYVENLSTFSYYRYMLFLIIALIGICTYLLFKLGVIPNSWESKLSFITFPYFKEEIRILLASRDISGSYCIRLTNLLIHSLTFRYVFFSIHFSVFYLFRLVCLCLFIRFVFFHGDLRILIYLLPISLLIWLLRFIEYYFFFFFDSNKNYIKDLLLVKTLTPLTSQELESQSITVTRNPSDLKFTLTDFGYKEGYTLENMNFVVSQWYLITNLQVTVLKYKNITSISSKLSLVINVITWITIVLKLLPFNQYSFIFGFNLEGLGVFSRRTFSSSRPLLARDSRFMKEHAMNPLKEKTNGAYSPGHPVYGEELPNGDYRIDGSLTHGSGSKDHPSHELGTTDAKGKPQRYIPHEPVEIPKGDLTASIPGSSQQLEHPQVKEKLDKGSKTQDQ
jgi:hypothetical protein